MPSPTDSIRFAAAITDQADPAAGSEALLEEISRGLAGQPAEAAFLFASTLYRGDLRPLLRRIRQGLGGATLIGCTAGGVLGQGKELEGIPSLALCAAHLPRVKLHPFTAAPSDLAEPEGGYWIEKIGASPAEEPVGILLPEPFSCDIAELLLRLGAAYPKAPLVGGLASGARQAGENQLFFNEEVISEGAVGLFLTGDIMLQTIVSQGCRPIGRPFIITKAQENLILELAGMPAAEALQKLYAELTAPDKRLARTALLLGVVMDEYKQSFRRGDFLIRNLIGMDPATGAIAVGDRVQAGQTVQFQVRDADTAREDLQTLLEDQRDRFNREPSAGALLFSCLGRGRDLYGEPHVDSRTIGKAIGQVPIAGFFCNGEIGPIGQRNYIHGFTSSLGLFRSRL